MARIYHDAVHQLGPRHYKAEQVAAWSPALPDAAEFAMRAGDGRLTIVATGDDDAILAFGDLEADGHVDRLYRRLDAHGRGVASGVLAALLGRAALVRLPRLYVEASKPARPLFERHGFLLVKRRAFDLRGVTMHNYLMERAGPAHAP